MPFNLGSTARLIAQCRDPGGTAATAGTATVTVTLPDGTTATPAAEETATVGTYQADYVTTAPGRHTVRWVFSNPAHAYTDVFDVWPEAPPPVLSLADAKNHINNSGSDEDDEIRFWINATTRAVEFFAGPIVVRAVTEKHNVRCVHELALRQVPALALTSLVAVLDGAPSYDAATLDLDGDTGIVQRKDGGLLYGPLRATYSAGRPIVTENITGCARVIFQHLWRTQRSGRRGGLAGGGDDYSVTEPIPGLGFAVPNRALELLGPDRLPPGMA
ncbi:hypothetical protein [Streptomyces sediminimaris]|uniref:hypothetical protein n=1 Tax=Streptomyces sediminimaris TaxID=3383721 RepID=UPI00399BDA36